jgi:TrpR-related protein YerC/YecD
MTRSETSPESIEELCRALCTLEAPEEARAFLLDICSKKEICDLSQRLEVARLLAAGESYVEVSHMTGASSTTVSRVSKCLNGPEGGYRLVLGRLGDGADGASDAADAPGAENASDAAGASGVEDE